MSKKFQPKNIIIEKSIYKKALRYAISLNEVGFLFFGNGNKITEVVRIKNIHKDKRNRFMWDAKTRRNVALRHSINYQTHIEGHSHSNKWHLRHPSGDDIRYFKHGLHIIVFPWEKTIRCWILNPELLSQPCKYEIKIKVFNNN